MKTEKHKADHTDQLRADWTEFLRPPRSVGDAVVVAYILKNISDFRDFVSDYPKLHQVAAQK